MTASGHSPFSQAQQRDQNAFACAGINQTTCICSSAWPQVSDFFVASHVFHIPHAAFCPAVASCQVGSDDIGKWMVRNGEALAYREFSKQYVEDELAAARSHTGIWKGTFELPKEWRKGRKSSGSNGTPPPVELPATAQMPKGASPLARPDCNIKGNISSTGERIYHMPQVVTSPRPCRNDAVAMFMPFSAVSGN